MTEHTPELRVRAMLQGGQVSLADFFVCGKLLMWLSSIPAVSLMCLKRLADAACGMCIAQCFLPAYFHLQD